MSSRLAWLSCACLLMFGGAGVNTALAADTALTGDATRGETVYSRCLACHALAYNRTGPQHCGLFGRKAGSLPGFDYSAAMKNSKIVWDDKTLNWFLTDPMAAVPGTSMGYAGIKDAQERADLIAYLKKANAGPECASKP